MASKSVIRRQKSFEMLKSVFRNFWDDVRTGLKRFLAENLGQEEDPDRLPEAVLARLERQMDRLLKADGEVTRLAAAERSRNKKMKEAADVLRVEVLHVKDILQLYYGDRYGEIFLDLSSHVLRRDPDRLLRLVRFAYDMLMSADPGVEVLAWFRKIKSWEPREYAEYLEKYLEKYEAAHASHEAVSGELEAARHQRLRTLDEYNEEFVDSASYLVYVFRISGHP